MKKTVSILLALPLVFIMALPLAGCTGSADKTFTVGICQLAQHDALDAATKGFKDALIEALGDSVTFDEQNASGDSAMCSTIVNSFTSKNVDLILANATPALQAAYNATTEIPILGTAVTEYGVALNIKDFSGVCGGNVSGTSDLAPLNEQAAMILELFPNAKNVGLLYCSAEANSEYQVKVVEEFLKSKGINAIRFSFADSNDVASVTTKAAAECDVIYIPTDNTAATCVETIGNIVKAKKVPVVAGESNICKTCGVATLSIDYYELGVTTGKMAAEILKDGKDISTMEIQYANAKKEFNEEICKELGITIPDGYTAIAK